MFFLSAVAFCCLLISLELYAFLFLSDTIYYFSIENLISYKSLFALFIPDSILERRAILFPSTATFFILERLATLFFLIARS